MGSPMNYFAKSNSTMPARVGNERIYFEHCDIYAGAQRGIFSTDRQDLIHGLREVADVQEISAEEYLALKSKKNASSSIVVLESSSQTQSQAVVRDRTPDLHQDESPGEDLLPEDEDAKIDKIGEVTEETPLLEEAGDEDEQAPSEPEFAKNYDDLASLLKIKDIDALKEAGREEDAPARSHKGHNVQEWREYLAKLEEAE